jgi:hypothetical protein
MQYANIWNANPSKAHLECNHTQCVNLCCAQASNARALCGCPVPFAVLLVPHARRVRAGCGGLVVAWSRPAAQPKFFRWMFLAMSWLLTSNGQRPNCCAGCCVGLLFCFPEKRRLLCNNGGRAPAAFLRRARTKFFAVCCSQCLSYLLPMASG